MALPVQPPSSFRLLWDLARRRSRSRSVHIPFRTPRCSSTSITSTFSKRHEHFSTIATTNCPCCGSFSNTGVYKKSISSNSCQNTTHVGFSKSKLHSSAARRGGDIDNFDRTSDYNYNLQNLVNGQSYRVRLTDEGFIWPANIDSSDSQTAFLEICVCTKSDDAPPMWPSISIVYEGDLESGHRKQHLVQSFDHGESGRRYLDVSPIIAAGMKPGSTVKLSSSSGVQWQNTETSLTVFPNLNIEDKHVLVLSPHPDDAEIAAFGLYSTSDKADVVTITAGDAGKKMFCSLWSEEGEHYRAKGHIRTIDSITVPLLAGLHPKSIRNLGYYDGTLSEMWTKRPDCVFPKLAKLMEPGYFRKLNCFDTELRQRAFLATWSNLVTDLLSELENVQPDIVVSPHPFLDRHLDHQFTTVALFEALAKWNREVNILLYTNHVVDAESFPFGPSHGMIGLPPVDVTNNSDLHVSGIYSHILSEEDRRQKLVALEAHHDLRQFDLRDRKEVLSAPDSKYNYYRRAGRPNELFFVTDKAGALKMHKQFLASLEEI